MTARYDVGAVLPEDGERLQLHEAVHDRVPRPASPHMTADPVLAGHTERLDDAASRAFPRCVVHGAEHQHHLVHRHAAATPHQAFGCTLAIAAAATLASHIDQPVARRVARNIPRRMLMYGRSQPRLQVFAVHSCHASLTCLSIGARGVPNSTSKVTGVQRGGPSANHVSGTPHRVRVWTLCANDFIPSNRSAS